MKTIEPNPILGQEAELFASMVGNYQSEKEQEFFEKMLYKQQWECSISHDVIMSERDNEDGIYIVRIDFDEYVVGKEGKEEDEVHVMCLLAALELNLKEIGVLDEDITLFEWLRRRDYAGVNYDADYDYE